MSTEFKTIEQLDHQMLAVLFARAFIQFLQHIHFGPPGSPNSLVVSHNLYCLEHRGCLLLLFWLVVALSNLYDAGKLAFSQFFDIFV